LDVDIVGQTYKIYVNIDKFHLIHTNLIAIYKYVKIC